MKKITSILVLIVLAQLGYSQMAHNKIGKTFVILGMTKDSGTSVVPSSNNISTNNSSHRVTAAPANDNFANATALTIYASAAPTFTAGTCDGGSLQANEDVECQGYNSSKWTTLGASCFATAVVSTVWYKFTATSTGPYYITLDEVTLEQSGGYNQYFHGMTIYNTSALPTSGSCGLCVQCMDNEDVGEENWLQNDKCFGGTKAEKIALEQPSMNEYTEIINNTVSGTTYYIQVGYPTASYADVFDIAVSTVAVTGATITNPLPVTAIGQCDAAGGCTAATCPILPDECPIAGCYAPLGGSGGNNCSNGGNVTVCTACPASGTDASCEPCLTYITSNCTGINLASNTGAYPNSSYPSYSADVYPGVTYGSLPLTAATSGGVLSPGYVISYCYDFTIPSTLSNVASFQTYFPSGATYAEECYAAITGEYWLNWTLYNAGCGSIVACGDFATGLTLNGMVCNTSYVLCVSMQMAGGTYIGNDPEGIYPFVSFSECNPANCSVLPIALVSLGAEYDEPTNDMYVYWSTASQTNNKEFVVEKSQDGASWQTVTTVAGAGTNDTMSYYRIVDHNPFPGVSYYRIKQVDFDGTATYSADVTVTTPNDYSVNLYPDPATNTVNFKYTSRDNNPITIEVFDMFGKSLLVQTKAVSAGDNSYTIDISSLQGGAYVVKVTNSVKTYYLKMVKE